MLSRKGEVGGGTLYSGTELINKNNNYYHWLNDPRRRALLSHLLFPFTCQRSGLKAFTIVQGLIAPVGKIGRQLSQKKKKSKTGKAGWGRRVEADDYASNKHSCSRIFPGFHSEVELCLWQLPTLMIFGMGTGNTWELCGSVSQSSDSHPRITPNGKQTSIVEVATLWQECLFSLLFSLISFYGSVVFPNKSLCQSMWERLRGEEPQGATAPLAAHPPKARTIWFFRVGSDGSGQGWKMGYLENCLLSFITHNPHVFHFEENYQHFRTHFFFHF